MAGNMDINGLFEAQAKSNPHAQAVVCLDHSITYQDLDKKSNQFCRYLQTTQRVRQGDVVAISVQTKSINLFIAILGILKAGAAYQAVRDPVDTQMQQNLACIIGNNKNAAVDINVLDTIIQSYDCESLTKMERDPSSVAYLISTSGTTGRPKTIAISHGNIVATFQSWQRIYELTSADHHLQMASVTFDVFTGDWVRALCSGGTLVLCPKSYLLRPELLCSLIEKNNITVAEFVPAVLRKLMAYLEEKQKKFSTFRVIICGSDIWYMGEYKKLKQLCEPQTRVINSYGLSETTVDATYFELQNNNSVNLPDDAIVPIGKPFPHVTLEVMTASGEPVKASEQGELYIGGEGISTYGYLDNPELTAQRFVELQGKKGLFYRTGDVAELLPNGEVLFLGRNENQFNVNGQRVDFLAVESVLLQHPKIKSAVVIPNQHQNRNFLEAFLVLQGDVQYSELVQYLKTHLPPYAIPKCFYETKRLVLNQSGKVVRKKDDQEIIREIIKQPLLPRTSVQSLIMTIWKKTLHQDSIGINDSFDALAGTSLDYVEIVSEVNRLFNTNIQLCMQLKTVADMADAVSSG